MQRERLHYVGNRIKCVESKLEYPYNYGRYYYVYDSVVETSFGIQFVADGKGKLPENVDEFNDKLIGLM
jgi:hypothetical protein